MVDYSRKTDEQLAELSQFGDIEARNALALRHQKLVRFLVNSYGQSYYIKNGKPLLKEDMEDLFQELMIVFLKQINAFDFDRKVKVTTYIAQWLHAKIIVFLKDKGAHVKKIVDVDVGDYYDVLEMADEKLPEELGLTLEEKERELYEQLFLHKCSLTYIAKQRKVDISVVFNEKKKLLNKVKNIIKIDSERLNLSIEPDIVYDDDNREIDSSKRTKKGNNR